MAQRPKDEIRRAILAAAVSELAEHGHARTTLAGVASRAGTSVGNLYRYFASKDELYAAAIPDTLAQQIARGVVERIDSFGAARGLEELGPEHRYWQVVRGLTTLALAHREELVFLLSRAEGSPHEGYAEARARELTQAALRHLHHAHPSLAPSAADRRALRRLYDGFVAAIARTLDEEKSRASLERALASLTTYHLAGLRAFFAQLPSTDQQAASAASEER